MKQVQTSLTPVFSSDINSQSLKNLKLILSNSPLRLIDRDGNAVELSPVMINALQQLVEIMLSGRSAAILPEKQYLSCQAAAELLGISRPYLYQLLDKGVISFFKVGSHRRLKFEDVIDYKINRSNDRHQALLELAELSKKIGLLSLDDQK
jgi:excisionase family DNA binding protein